MLGDLRGCGMTSGMTETRLCPYLQSHFLRRRSVWRTLSRQALVSAFDGGAASARASAPPPDRRTHGGQTAPVIRSAVISNANAGCGKTKAFMNQSFGRRIGQVLSGLQHLQHLFCIILHIHDLWEPLKVNGSFSLLCGAAFIWADQCDVKYQS